MTETLESIAVEIAFGDEEFKCPFPHAPTTHDRKNKIPTEVKNDGSVLSTNLQSESHHIERADIRPPYEFSATRTVDKVGYAAHHLIPGNEMWNNKGHPLHDWIHAAKGKVKGDIGYENNNKYNGIDLPSHFLVTGWGGISKQEGYAYAAMTADTKHRQFHDAHKAYSDLVWNSLVKIAEKLDALVKAKGCGKRDCPASGEPKYDPPYKVLDQLIGVATRLRGRVHGSVSMWKAPIMTSRFALMYKNGGIDQEEAREKLAKMREEMGSPTG